MLLSSGITSPKFASATFNATQNNNNNFNYGQKTLRAKVLEFFEQHAPAKTATVDILIEKFKDEDASALISKLEAKYNVKMPADNNNNTSGSNGLLTFAQQSPLSSFTFNNNTNMLAPASFISSFGGQTKKLPPQPPQPPPSTNNSLRSRLIDFFKNNNAEDKIITVDILIEKYKGNEKQIFQALKTKYEQGKNNNIAKSNAMVAVEKDSSNINAPDSIPFFDLEGKRELLTKERAIELFQPITNENAQTVEKIRLSSKSFDEASAIVAAEKLRLMKNLRYADLSDIIAGRETSIGLKVLSTFSEALVETPLLWVDLSDNALGPRGVNVCEPLLSSSETLEGIAFRNDGLSAEACYEIKRLFLKLSSPTRLKKLHFWNNMSGDGGGIATAELLSQSPFMEDFQLSTTRCGEEGGNAICASLKNCPMLQKIDLSDNTFNVSGAIELSKSLRSLPRMVVLNIGDLNFKDEGIGHLLKALVQPVCPVLETLDISLNDVSVDSLKYLPDALAGKNQFKKLIVKGNFDLGNKGCVIIGKTFNANGFSSKVLEAIDLEECDIHDRGAIFLANELGSSIGNKHRNFKLLNLKDNKISDSACKMVQAKMSTAEISMEDQMEESDYESDGDDIDLKSVSKTIAEIYSPKSSPKAVVEEIATPFLSFGNSSSSSNGGKSLNIDSNDLSFRQKLYKYYNKVEPRKLHSMDILLEKYNGKQTKLVMDLESKYKVTFNSKSLLGNGGTNNNNIGRGNRPRIVQSLEEGMYEEVKKEPPQQEESVNLVFFRKQLLHFYKRYAPEKMNSIDILLAKFKRNEKQLIKTLEKKYNVNFARDKEAPPVTTMTTTTTTLRVQLFNFFKKHNPRNLETVDILLEKNDLSADELMSKLKSKYGINSNKNVMDNAPMENFSTKTLVFDLGNEGQDETITLDMIHERLQVHSQTNLSEIGSIVFNDKSFDVDAMDVLASKVTEMENLHTAQLRNMTHGRDPAEGLGAKACSILISALTSKKLRSLDISSNMLGAAAGEIWGPLLTSQPYVEELIFEADHRFRHGYKGDACNDLLKNFEPKNLKKLVVVKHADDEPLTGDGVAAIFSTVIANSTLLEHLCYTKNKCGTDGGIQISEALGNCGKNLTFLDLSENNFHAEGGVALGNAISSMQALRTLKLDDMGLEDEGVSSILHELCGSCSDLEVLSFKYNDATSDGIKSLYNALENKAKLFELRLGGNPIEREGCIIVQKALPSLNGLQVLDMEECGLHNNSAIALCDDIIKIFKSISKLELDSNNLTDTGVNVVTNKITEVFGEESLGDFDCNDPPEMEDATDELDKIQDDVVKQYGTEKKSSNSSEEEKVSEKNNSGSGGIFANFAPKPGSWKCPVCMINNNKEANKCVSCEAPNPNAESMPTDTSKSNGFGTGGDVGGTKFTFGSSNSSTSAIETKVSTSVNNSGGDVGGTKVTFGSSNSSTPKIAGENGSLSFGSPPKVAEGGFSFGTATGGFGQPTGSTITFGAPQPSTTNTPVFGGGDNTQSTGGFGQKEGSTNTFGAPQPSTTNTPVFGVDITPKVEETTKVSVAGKDVKSEVSYGDFSNHYSDDTDNNNNNNDNNDDDKKEIHHALGAKIFDFNVVNDGGNGGTTNNNDYNDAGHLTLEEKLAAAEKEKQNLLNAMKALVGEKQLKVIVKGSASPAAVGTPGRYNNNGGGTPGLRLSNLERLSSPIIVVSSPSTLAVSGPRIINPPWQRSLQQIDNEIFEKDIRTTTSWWRRKPRNERRATVTQALRLWSKSKVIPPTVSMHDHSFRTDTKFSAKKFLKRTRLMISSNEDVYVGSVILETANRAGNLKSLLPKWGITLLNC